MTPSDGGRDWGHRLPPSHTCRRFPQDTALDKNTAAAAGFTTRCLLLPGNAPTETSPPLSVTSHGDGFEHRRNDEAAQRPRTRPPTSTPPCHQRCIRRSQPPLRVPPLRRGETPSRTHRTHDADSWLCVRSDRQPSPTCLV
jgi:hypothetical protein